MKKRDQRSPISDEANRLGWVKWYCVNWAGSTKLFDADQKGWYMDLLMHAASQGEPPGYLNNDDDELKQLAGYTLAPKDMLTALSVDSSCDRIAILDALAYARELKWSKMLRKFEESDEYPGLIFNSKLVKTLNEAYKTIKISKDAATIAATARWDKYRKEKGLNAHAKQPHSEGITSAMPSQSDRYANKEKEEDIEIRKNSTKNVEQKSTASDRKKPKTLFDEKRFIVTDKMIAHLLEKYNDPGDDTIPEFTIGDINYLAEKFKLTFHGETYRSWSMTFYRFVSNQFVKYGYVPGQYNWRARGASQKNSGQTKMFESSSERNARLEQENAKLFTDEDPANIQDSSQGNDRVNPTRLSLAIDGD